MAKKTTPSDDMHTIDRYRFLTILTAAQKCEEFQFIKQATMMWLVNYPGDLYVQYQQALALENLNNHSQAIGLFESLVQQDPMFVEPNEALSKFSDHEEKRQFYKSITDYLKQENAADQASDSWIAPLWIARAEFAQGNIEEAINLTHQSLVKNPDTPIPAILHLKIAYKSENEEMLSNLTEIYYQQWPNCLQVNIIKALSDINQGKEAEGVERLHYAAAHDSAGQVIHSLMGKKHRFADLWPDHMDIFFDLPIPASVSSYLGWNQLGSGEIQTPEIKFTQPTQPIESINDEITKKIHITRDATPEKTVVQSAPAKIGKTTEAGETYATQEDFEEIQKTFSKLARRLKKADPGRSDNRYPVYVVMTSKKHLETIYGPNTAAVIDELLTKLVGLIQELPDWSSMLFYPDNPTTLSQLGLKPHLANDAWQVKLALADLDEALAKQGEMIGALLIVGGPEIIPFHHLPNPTFDDDLDVPSDNPYATIDENYFIPQWPVGRLPGETGSDAGLLLSQVRKLIYQYQKRSKHAKTGPFNIGGLINGIVSFLSNMTQSVTPKPNLAYSAEIWKEASRSVYRSVGTAKELQLSPPIHSGSLALKNSTKLNIGYFNLHGVKDGPNWYGQKDFSSNSQGPDYPIALKPAMFNEKTTSPKIIFSEACYGANVIQKNNDDAISLKSVDHGTSSFVGSTCIAYGSLKPPLIAADFIASAFWEKVLAGEPTGYALMQAKLSLAEEMVRQQGFLDGEDQKTILSFIHYGDPLGVYNEYQSMPKPLLRAKAHPKVRTLSDSDMETFQDPESMPKDMNIQVKKIVEKYLPGLDNAQIQVNKSLPDFHPQAKGNTSSERFVVTMRKSYEKNSELVHHHFARMTFDKKGKLVKLTTSR